MHAKATAARKAADNATKTTPSIRSTGRRSAFRPVSSRASRVTRRALTLVITGGRLWLGGPGTDAENGTVGLPEGTSRSGWLMYRRGPERRRPGGVAAWIAAP